MTILKMLFVIFTLSALFGIAYFLKTKYKLNPELSRKIIHIGTGLTSLSFPFLFTNPLPVIILGICSISALLFLKLSKLSFRESLFSVSRKSNGEIFFAISIVLLFCVAHKTPVIYSIPLIILSFADTSAALIGVSYGKNFLANKTEDTKSIEGSFAFFITAFLCTLIPLLLFTNVGRAETLLISLTIGILTCLIEMTSWKGNDNLLLPLLAFAFLKYQMNFTSIILIKNLLIFTLLFVFLIIYSKKFLSLSTLALFEGILLAYIITMLSNLVYLYAPLIFFITFGILPKLTNEEKEQNINFKIVLTNVIIGIFWLWLNIIFDLKEYIFFCYNLTFACHLTMNTFCRYKYYHNITIKKAITDSTIKSVVLILIPGFIWHYYIIEEFNLLLSLLSILFVFCSAITISKLTEKFNYKELNTKYGWYNATTVLIISTTMFLIQLLI